MTLALPRSKSRGKFCCLSIARHLDKNEARGFAACILAHGVVAAEVTAKQCQSNRVASTRQEIATCTPRSRWAGRTGIPGRRSGRPSRPPLPLLLHPPLLLLLRHSSPVRSRRAMHVTSTDHHRRTNGRGDQPPPPPPAAAAAAARRRPTALSERKQCQAMLLLLLLLLPGQGVGGAPCLRRRPRSSSSR